MLVSSGKASLDVVERSLAALSFDVENGKIGNLANILFGVLNSGREYISQKYSEKLQNELNDELSRIHQAEENKKRIIEARLKVKFDDWYQTASLSDKTKIAEPNIIAPENSEAYKQVLRAAFFQKTQDESI